MKNALFTFALVIVGFNSLLGQCDVDPIWDAALIPNFTLLTSDGDGYCPNTTADIDISISGDPEANGAVTDGSSGVNPDCDVSLLTFSYVDSHDNDGCSETIIRTWTAEYTDGNALFATHDQIITLEDDTPPTLNCPSTVTVEFDTACDETEPNIETETGFAYGSDSGISEADYESMTDGDVEDDCFDIMLEYSDGPLTMMDCTEGAAYYTFERTWSLTDNCGNFVDCIQIVELYDNTVPTLECPPVVTIELSTECDETEPNIETEAGYPYGSGTITQSDYTSISGDYMSEDQCIMDYNISYDDGPIAVMEDNCPGAFITFERTWTVTDQCGNENSCVQTIELYDNTEPDGVIPPDFDDTVMLNACDEEDPNILAETGFVYSDTPQIVPESNFEDAGGLIDDNCKDLYMLEYMYVDVFTEFEDNCPDEVGEIIRTWTVTDHCGNTFEMDQTILMYDTEGPMILTCPGDNVALQIPIAYPEVCDETSPLIEEASGFPYNAAPTTINIDEFPGFAQDNCNDGEIWMAEYFDEIVGTGCESGAFVALDLLRTWTVSDFCGNTTTCEQVIQLMDFEGPILLLEADFFYLQDEDNPLGPMMFEAVFCEKELEWLDPMSMADLVDNCTMFPDIEWMSDITSPHTFAEGTTTITYIFRDECENSTEITWDVTVTCVPCGPNMVFTECDQPPTLCDLTEIDAFTSCTPEYGGSIIGPLCSGFVVNNPSYFEFIAGEETLTLTVTPSNCLNGQGVQAAVIEVCNPSNCFDDDGGNCHNEVFSITASGLTVGNIYQLIVDGCAGDECNWSVEISTVPFQIPDLDGVEEEAELPSFGSCDVSDLIFCIGSEVTFYPQDFEEAEYYFCWNIDNQNGVAAQNNEFDCTEFVAPTPTGLGFQCSSDYSSCGPLQLTFTELGTYTLCLVEAENGCDNEQPGDFCYEIQIIENGPIDFGEFNVCEHDLPWFVNAEGPNGETWGGPPVGEGISEFDVSDDCGCEFTYMIQVNILEEEDSFAEVEVCAADFEDWVDPVLGIDYDDVEEYFDFGSNSAIFQPLEEASTQIGWDGIECDSFIIIEFFIYDVPGQIISTPGPACDEILTLMVDDFEFPEFMDTEEFLYSWFDFNNQNIGTDPSVSVTENGNYYLELSYFLQDGNICNYFFDVNVDIGGSPPGQPVFNLAPTQTCPDALTGLVYAVPPAAAADYMWNVTNGTFVENPDGSQITVDITDPSLPLEVCVFSQSVCGMSPDICAVLNVQEPPVIDLMFPDSVCVNQVASISSSLITGSADEYFWIVDNPAANWTMTGSNSSPNLDISWPTPGLQTFTLYIEDLGGCESNTVNGSVMVVPELAPPTYDCTSNSNSVTITWVDADPGVGTTVNVTSGQTGTQTGNSMVVTGLNSGDAVTFELITLGGTYPCGNTDAIIANCVADDCPLDPLIESPEDNICLDGSEEPFQLLETNGNPGGVWAGPGTNDSGMFDPAAAGPGTHTITYDVEDTTADCSANTDMTITVLPSPFEMFQPNLDTVCIGEDVIIEFPDTDGYDYGWFFDGGVSTTFEDTGFPINWDTPGDKLIIMTVNSGPNQGDCQAIFEMPIYVRPPLEFPGIFCGDLSPVSVGFNWNPVEGVEEYEIEIYIDGVLSNTVTQDGTDITVDGLTQGNVVELVATAFDSNGCNNPVATGECTAQDCPTFDIVPDADQLVACWDPGDPVQIQLTQMSLDADGNAVDGTGEWVGTGIDPTTGLFSPTGPGEYVLSYSFVQDGTNCPGVGEITINILDAPISDFVQDEEEICVTEQVVFTYEGLYDSSIDFGWTSTFDDASYEITDNGDGEFLVEFSDEGQGSFTLVTTVGDCVSPPTTLFVDVELVPTIPDISCITDLGTILFDWTEVDCAQAYDVYIDGESVGIITDSEIMISDLTENQEVEIEILLISDCLCEFDEPVELMCTANACAPATIAFDGAVMTSYCLSEIPAPFQYEANVDGVDIDGSGIFTWNGTGISPTGMVDLSGFGAGTYTFEVLYEEDDCSYMDQIVFEILSEPIVNIGTDDAPCFDQPIGNLNMNVEGNGALTYNLLNAAGENIGGDDLISGDNALGVGSYTLNVVDENNCMSEVSFEIATAPEPTDELTVPSFIFKDSVEILNYNIQVNGVTNVEWSINGDIVADLDCATEDCFNLEYSPAEVGDYEVCTTAYYGDGCSVVECREFKSDDLNFTSFYIPNVIFPEDENPENQTLNIYVVGDPIFVKSIGIYDRWGNRVHFDPTEFTVNNGESATLWDGNFEQGTDFMSGVYVYIVETDVDGNTEYITDDVTVVY